MSDGWKRIWEKCRRANGVVWVHEVEGEVCVCVCVWVGVGVGVCVCVCVYGGGGGMRE
jgi:hypothetical protein